MTILSLPSKWRSLYGARQISVFAALLLLLMLFGAAAPAYANNTFGVTTITGTSGSTTGTTVGATGQSGEPTTYGGGSLNTIWYNWTAASSGTVTFQTCGGTTNFDTTLAAFTGGTVSTLTSVATNDDSCGAQSLITFNAVAGTTYRIQVDGYGSATGNFTLSWNLVVTRVAGTPPTLTCPAGSSILDWDTTTWTAGSTNGTSTVSGIGAVGIGITTPTGGTWGNIAALGGQSPAKSSTITGGFTAQQSLIQYIDFANQTQTAETTFTLPTTITGAQFRIYDLDFGSGQFADKVTITGYNGLTPVLPTVTNGVANYVSTNVAIGDAESTDLSANGNVVVTFTGPIDRIVVSYGSHTTAPANPNGQAIALADMTFCRPQADLSLSKTVSNASPSVGSAISYTLTVSSAASPASNGTATGITVRDTLPAGFTFTSASGTGTYNAGTGVWTVGSLAPGASATITINGTVSAATGATVTNIAQISASSLLDPDSTVNNGVTTEDDYAFATFTVPSVINCPTGSTSTGSGFATGGTGLYQEQIFWLDWTCGATTSYPAGATVNKSWDAGDGLVITGQVTNITGSALEGYSTGGWVGDLLDDMYPGVNPIGLGAFGGADPSFRVTYSATLNGITVPLRYVVADAEQTDAGSETMSAITTGSSWQLVEKQGTIVETLAGTSASWSGGGSSSSVIIETSGNIVQIDASMINNGGQFFAFGVFTPFDFSDAPLTGTSYGSANHRTIGNYILGASVTSEAAAYDTPAANGDVDNGVVTVPTFLRGQTATVNVSVQGRGYLSSWIDFNDDGDWADAGEKVATDLRDGGAGDLDGAINGNIQFQVAVPATAALTPTIARFRYSSRTNAPTTGLWGFGEVEDYQFTIQNAELTLAKTSTVISDPVNGTTNPKRIPGAVVRYCILTTNVGTATASNVTATDNLPANVTFISGTMRSGTTCAGATDVEDFDATGTDESNPFGMSTDTYIVNGSAPTLAPGGTFAMVFDVLVEPAPLP